MPPESDHDLLLDAAISHLESLKRQGIRFIEVDRQLLREVTTACPISQPPSTISVTNPPPAAPLSTAPRATAPAPAIAVRPPRTATRPAELILLPSSGLVIPLAEKSSGPPLHPDQKEHLFNQLRERVLKCVQCAHLASTRRNVVFGVGNIHSEIMFVGEAPGADEDVQGEPFVGAAGQLLTKVIQAMGLSRERVYIGNVLKCRPDTPGQAYGNRKPAPAEMSTCLPYLEEQIRIIQPKVIIALGATAMEGLLGKSPISISKLRGQWQQFQGIPVMPTYHPSYVLRNQSLATKRETWEDMLAAMERLQMPISEKQRGYFLKG